MLTVPIEDQLKVSQKTEYHQLNLKRNGFMELMKKAVLNPDPVDNRLTIMAMAQANPFGLMLDMVRATKSLKALRGGEK